MTGCVVYQAFTTSLEMSAGGELGWGFYLNAFHNQLLSTQFKDLVCLSLTLNISYISIFLRLITFTELCSKGLETILSQCPKIPIMLLFNFINRNFVNKNKNLTLQSCKVAARNKSTPHLTVHCSRRLAHICQRCVVRPAQQCDRNSHLRIKGCWNSDTRGEL